MTGCYHSLPFSQGNCIWFMRLLTPNIIQPITLLMKQTDFTHLVLITINDPLLLNDYHPQLCGWMFIPISWVVPLDAPLYILLLSSLMTRRVVTNPWSKPDRVKLSMAKWSDAKVKKIRKRENRKPWTPAARASGRGSRWHRALVVPAHCRGRPRLAIVQAEKIKKRPAGHGLICGDGTPWWQRTPTWEDVLWQSYDAFFGWPPYDTFCGFAQSCKLLGSAFVSVTICWWRFNAVALNTSSAAHACLMVRAKTGIARILKDQQLSS